MESKVARLVDKAWERYLETPETARLLIGIAGIPGSGKTSISQVVTHALNARAAAAAAAALAAASPGSHPAAEVAAFVPMDGFHLTRAQLSAMPDPAAAHARRGAEFTFDGAGFLALVEALRAPLLPQPPHSAAAAAAADVLAPSFDHAVKDPAPDSIAVRPGHRVVVLEGNYLLLDREPWRSAAALLDERWFVEVDPGVARRRLAARHVAAGICATREEAERRADENDLPNGHEILRLRLTPHEVIVSEEDVAWVGALQK
ncbi:phosphoribulokinase/uridine kinase [Gaeumannomyces tritici R3-111a-1]|uniref:Phosphoribulokinase/uridine kinase n=1 Tax=Gaeumannomyces tritici (strain R3-111a-1) TaxID=644352 RepID=J3NHC0_GAET3|nr:phosphoribulokinase/uridine kinase [Gaeumannomyces tritici R3-111a-1]EJT80663.1 phosphoribulokinase/uridine kinase [Gaeumannomyces tritici R3-111a-1]